MNSVSSQMLSSRLWEFSKICTKTLQTSKGITIQKGISFHDVVMISQNVTSIVLRSNLPSYSLLLFQDPRWRHEPYQPALSAASGGSSRWSWYHLTPPIWPPSWRSRGWRHPLKMRMICPSKLKSNTEQYTEVPQWLSSRQENKIF